MSVLEIIAFILLTVGFSFLFSGTLFKTKEEDAKKSSSHKKPLKHNLEQLSLEGIVDMLSLCLIDPTDSNPYTSASSLLKVLHKQLDKPSYEHKQATTETNKKLSDVLVSFLEIKNMTVDILLDVLVAVGLCVLDETQMQTTMADRGVIRAIVRHLNENSGHASDGLTKWYFWALTNICFNHPPNKCEFIHKGGLSAVIAALKQDKPKMNMVQKQGLSLLAYILRDDVQSKFHIGDARRGAIANGLVGVIQEAQTQFRDDKDIQTSCTFIMELLAIAY